MSKDEKDNSEGNNQSISDLITELTNSGVEFDDSKLFFLNLLVELSEDYLSVPSISISEFEKHVAYLDDEERTIFQQLLEDYKVVKHEVTRSVIVRAIVGMFYDQLSEEEDEDYEIISSFFGEYDDDFLDVEYENDDDEDDDNDDEDNDDED